MARRSIVRAQRRAGFESDRWYLDVYDRATGAKRTVFETPDLSVERFRARRSDGRRSGSPAGRMAARTCSRAGWPAARRSRVAAGRRDRVGAARRRTSSCSRSPRSRRRPDLFRVVGRRRRAQAAHARERGWLKDVAFPSRESLTVAGAGRHAGAVLADQAAGLRSVEEIPGRVPHPRRTAGRVGGRMVHALEPVAVGGAGLGRRGAEPARLDRLRPEVRRRDLAATGPARS